ncbi:MAG: ABC transporter permease [Candidatus Marinimicrobia bacterium]|nr:ABC transporter permease [Candidatus Neomarinimicrobiota bacterium]MCF7905226.1 ABC transporter permease [Candidatus Neomarinimicrobiota bacterium]
MMIRLIQNELYKIFSLIRSYIGAVLFTIIIPLILWGYGKGTSHIENEISGSVSDMFLIEGSPTNGFTAAYFIMNFFWVHVPFLIALVGGDIFAGEQANGTFRIYATRPISRLSIFISKSLATMIYTLVFVLYFALLTLGLGLVWYGGGDMLVFHDGILILEGWDAARRFVIAYAFTFVNMALVSAIAIFFSSMVRNAVGPVIGTMAVIIFSLMVSTLPLEIFKGIHPYMFTSYFSNWEQAFHDPIPWADLFRGMNLVLANIFLFLGIAYIIFRRKDILS